MSAARRLTFRPCCRCKIATFRRLLTYVLGPTPSSNLRARIGALELDLFATTPRLKRELEPRPRADSPRHQARPYSARQPWGPEGMFAREPAEGNSEHKPCVRGLRPSDGEGDPVQATPLPPRKNRTARDNLDNGSTRRTWYDSLGLCERHCDLQFLWPRFFAPWPWRPSCFCPVSWEPR